MAKIIGLILATALVLAGRVGSWTVFTTTDVKAASKTTNTDTGGRTPIRGGRYAMQSVF
jgi:hypothetical protein